MLPSAAMISFGRIMLSININTYYTIDFFLSACFAREAVLEQRRKGFNSTEFNLVVSWQHRYPEIQTRLRPSTISLLDPVL